MRILLLFITHLLLLQVGHSQVPVPYSNNFDNSTDSMGWYHYAINGPDDWEMGNPNGAQFLTANSLFNAWVTNINGYCSSGSEMVLETPFFDLSNTSANSIVSFYHRRRHSTDYASAYSKLEYSLDSINWYLLDNGVAQKKNWQTIQGFSGSFSSLFTHSAFDLAFLQGNDSVKFRFRFVTNVSNQEGWMIDDFRIDEPYFNLFPSYGDTIKGINKNFPDFEVDFSWVFQNQWNSSYNFTCSYFLSDDIILDVGDLFLGSYTNNISSTDYSFPKTFAMPAGISSGHHYVLYLLDSTNILNENNETDNLGYVILELDSLYESPYSEYFDSSITIWNKTIDQSSTNWHWGPSNYFHVENARSGNNVYFTRESLFNPDGLYSPYLDLTNSSNTVLCFWYKHLENYNFSLKTQIANISPMVEEPNFPSPNSSPNISPSRIYGWDCHCTDFSSHDGIQSTKIRLIGPSYNNDNYVFIDDVYIGSAKPDATIEYETIHHFTRENDITDSLGYYFFNGGLTSMISTETKFYYSLDSIFDGADLYLGSNIEPSMTDTSFIWQTFSYTKPNTSIQEYYIIYEIDANSSIDEMHEYDNIGYVKINQLANESLPYFNDFETDITNWMHFSSIGTDDWVWGVPSGSEIPEAFSGLKGLVTSDTGLVHTYSRSHMLTPTFNLTQLNDPVLEFRVNYTLRDSSNIYLNSNDTRLNLMYSINGGSTWLTCTPSNESYKGPYSSFEYNSTTGLDEEGNTLIDNTLYHKNQKCFSPISFFYGRDYMDLTEVVIDLEALKDYENIRFMFVFACGEEPSEGALIDDFEIRERNIDLVNITHKNMMISSNDKFIRDHIDIKNDQNYISDSTSVKFYLSSDSTLQIGQDLFMQEASIPAIRPYKKFYCGLNFPTPQNLSDFNYLLIDVDPSNLNNENNEQNNLSFLKLNIDTANYFQYPLLFDFNSPEIDGWCWYNDSTGLMTNNQHYFRYRHQPVGYGLLNNFNDAAFDCMPGTWFMDPFDVPQYGYDWDYLAITSLESPSLDFSSTSNVQLEFDFLSVGKMNPTSERQGGNMQYSIDGGETWTTMTSAMDPNAVNWYNSNDVTSLNGEPGWVGISVPFQGDLLHAEFDADFLSGEQNVKFRFNHRASVKTSGPGPQGFRLDNFLIHGNYVDTLASLSICIGDSIQIFGAYQDQSGFYVDSLQNLLGNDSVIVQELNIRLSFNILSNMDVCFGDNCPLPDGTIIQAIENDTIHISSLSTDLGCDSIIQTTINVIIIDNTLSENGNDFISNQPIGNYQWLICPDLSPIINASSQSFTPTLDSAYAVVINYNGCVDTSDCVSHSFAGLSDQWNAGSIQIYPNPTNGKITIDLGRNYTDLKVSIQNIMGQEVFEREYKDTDEINLEFEGVKGTYFIELKFKNNEVFRYKIVKQ